MKYLPEFLLPLCLWSSLPAQNLLHRPNVLWAGVVEQELTADRMCSNDGTLNEMLVLKFEQPRGGELAWEDDFLANEVLNALYDGQLKVYSDPECLHPTVWQEIWKMTDTIMTFDPDTYAERITVVKFQKIDASQIERWRVRAVLYYDQRHAEWNLTDIRVAPMGLTYDSKGTLKPLFWFKADHKKPGTRHRNLPWIKTLIPTAPESFFFPYGAQVLKNLRPGDSPFQAMLDACKNRRDIVFYSTGKYGGDKPLTTEQKNYLFARRDTSISIDPLTHEETLHVEQRELSVEALRVMETWSWDYSRKRLYIRAAASAPIHYNRDREGRLRYYQPLFYSRNR